MRSYIHFLTLLAVTVAAPLSAQAGGPCQDSLTTYGMSTCLQARQQRADSLLNRYYAAARRHAVDPTRLRTAETAWIHFRDLNCEARASEWKGGSGQGLVQSRCLHDMTVARTHELWAAYLRTDGVLPEPGS